VNFRDLSDHYSEHGISGLSTAMLKAAWSADGGRSESGPCRWFVGIQIGGLCRAAVHEQGDDNHA